MLEPLLPRLKQEIEARLEELRPFVQEGEQLEVAKAALRVNPALAAVLAGTAVPAPAPAARSRGRKPAVRSVAAGPAKGAARDGAAQGDRAPRGANREAILALVEERPGVSIAEIASVTKIGKPTVATTVSKLKREGVLADEAGGVKLASRAPVTLASTHSTGSGRDEGATDAEWDSANPTASSEDGAVV